MKHTWVACEVYWKRAHSVSLSVHSSHIVSSSATTRLWHRRTMSSLIRTVGDSVYTGLSPNNLLVINFSLQNKLDLVQGMMDCLFAKCECRHSAYTPSSSYFFSSGIPCVSDCVIAELEKLGTKYRMALR